MPLGSESVEQGKKPAKTKFAFLLEKARWEIVRWLLQPAAETRL